ncbi:MAG: hypothetical protein J0I42_21425 [Bosea sp.]|uniref:hypothetical protein n=1 Tax=Bosea sp. (in: a-proteobacteria) TaxID=1871050 RepID=UPI001ACEB630|nr:hypothetical protein [Bosea sp. (in: a-proteobacteria)]MBN9454506.1 hypothetical protein [Bosea sp. (in: a-proteobacteria)]
MPKDSDFPAPTTMAARLGSDLLLSLGVATAAALLVMVPVLMSDAAPDRAKAPTLTLLRDGKIGDRLAAFGSAGEEGFSAAHPLTPAALAMPMALAWPEQSDWASPQTVVQAKAPAAASAVALPPRRLAVLSEKKGQGLAAPLVILPPAAMASVEPVQAAGAAGGEAADSSLRQFVVAPAMKVVDVVSGAAGSVQAAGSWTLTQANGLLPRW